MVAVMMLVLVVWVTYASGFALKTPRMRAFLSKLTMSGKADKRVVIVGATGYIGYILVHACPRAPL
jgi:hypothetical protein